MKNMTKIYIENINEIGGSKGSLFNLSAKGLTFQDVKLNDHKDQICQNLLKMQKKLFPKTSVNLGPLSSNQSLSFWQQSIY